jgi:uncharacterized Zn finger protein
MEYVNMFIILTYVIVLFIVYRYQTAVIKGQKDLNKTLTDKLNVLEKFQSIFDLKKVEEYVKIIEDKHKKDIYDAITSKTSDSIKAVVSTAYKEVPKEIMGSYIELLEMSHKTVMRLTPESREILFLNMPFNEERLRKLITISEDPHKT